GIVHLGDAAAAPEDLTRAHELEAGPVRTHRYRAVVLGAGQDPRAPQLRKTAVKIDLGPGIGVRARGVVDAQRSVQLGLAGKALRRRKRDLAERHAQAVAAGDVNLSGARQRLAVRDLVARERFGTRAHRHPPYGGITRIRSWGHRHRRTLSHPPSVA